MPIRDLLIHIDNTSACKNRILAAQKIADVGSAHVTGIYTYQVVIVPTYTEVGVPAYIYSEIEASNMELAEEAKALFNDSMSAWDSKIAWECHEGDRGATISKVAANHDLVVMGQHNPDDELDRNDGVAAQVAISSGRPVMIIPHSGSINHIGKRILVAWDGKKEAVRAVNDAMPFLKSADAVEVVNINHSDDPGIPCADIAAHLARHNIDVEAGSAHTKSGHTGEAILYLGQNFAADLIVMGAYGHSRLRELIIGGATKHVLQNTTVPVLISH
jgi:nucleotide-binding universal stress UspA family protein